ncbi:MAG TPA: hypothetical protein VK057_06935 [Bacillota bacterium]|nr:hypothetical protein [Bacillota bacterium]
MAQAVMLVGVIITIALVVINLVLLRATAKEKFVGYFPSLVAFIVGLLFLLVATYINESFLGAPVGGWGIATLFASAVSFIITALVDTYRHHGDAKRA